MVLIFGVQKYGWMACCMGISHLKLRTNSLYLPFLTKLRKKIVTPAHVAGFLVWQLNQNFTINTIISRYYGLQFFFRLLQNVEFNTHPETKNVLRMLKNQPNTTPFRAKFLESDAVVDFVAFSKQNRDLYGLLGEYMEIGSTFMSRISEITQRTFADFHWFPTSSNDVEGNFQMKIKLVKNANFETSKTVPCHPENFLQSYIASLTIMKRYKHLKLHHNSFVFGYESGVPLGTTELQKLFRIAKKSWANDYFLRTSKDYRNKKITWHSLRISVIVFSYLAGMSAEQIRVISGHASGSKTLNEVYIRRLEEIENTAYSHVLLQNFSSTSFQNVISQLNAQGNLKRKMSSNFIFFHCYNFKPILKFYKLIIFSKNNSHS